MSYLTKFMTSRRNKFRLITPKNIQYIIAIKIDDTFMDSTVMIVGYDLNISKLFILLIPVF